MSKFVRLVRRLAIVAVLTLGAAVAFAQEGTPIDVVYLKNGSVVRGTLVEYTAGKGVKIKTADGSIFVYAEAEVDRVAREFVKEAKKAPKVESAAETREESQGFNGYTRKKGFHAFFEAAVGGASGLMVGTTPALTLGYQASPLFFIGGGIAINHYLILLDEVENHYHFGLPLFVDARFDIGRKHSFFIDTRIGGTALFSQGDHGGFFFSLTPGARFALPNSSGGISLGLGYEGTLGATLYVKLRELGAATQVQGGLHAVMFRFIVDF